ncbi:unnamed protein product [Urochloa humidicola]
MSLSLILSVSKKFPIAKRGHQAAAVSRQPELEEGTRAPPPATERMVNFSRRLTHAQEDDNGGAPRASSRRRRIQPPRDFVPPMEEAIRFIAVVQREFAGEPDKYDGRD